MKINTEISRKIRNYLPSRSESPFPLSESGDGSHEALATSMEEEIRFLTKGVNFVHHRDYESNEFISIKERRRERPSFQPEFRDVLRGHLLVSGRYWKILSGFSNRTIEIDVLSGQSQQMITYKVRPEDKKVVDLVVNYDRPSDPTTQEEFLHAAQEIAAGHVICPEGQTFVGFKTTEQLVHSSYLLDLVLSAAAMEIGEDEFKFWHDLADKQLKNDRKLFIANSYEWPRTLLGKSVNARFRYQVVDPSFIGIRLKNLGEYFDGMYFDRQKRFLDQTAIIFEVGSLAYGLQHRDLAYSLVDCATDEQDPESIGRAAIEWGKAILKYYKGTPKEYELVSHHSYFQDSIPDGYFNYELPNVFSEELKRILSRFHSPNEFCSEYVFRKLGGDMWTESVGNIISSFFDNGQRIDSPRFRRTLEENGVKPDEFKTILEKAKTTHEKQLRENMGGLDRCGVSVKRISPELLYGKNEVILSQKLEPIKKSRINISEILGFIQKSIKK